MPDIRFSVPNSPGRMARATRALADAGIDIRGLGIDIRPGEQWGFIHFLVEDVEGAVRALEQVGCQVLDIHDVDVVETEDRIGAIAELCESYAERGDSIEVLYVGAHNRIVVGTESMRHPKLGGRMQDATYTDKRVTP